MLAATIRNLRALHAQPGAAAPNEVLRRVDLLDQEAQTLARPGKVALGTWHLLHTYLTATIEATLGAAAASLPAANSCEGVPAQQLAPPVRLPIE